MAKTESDGPGKVEKPMNPDPFELPKQLRKRLQDARSAVAENPDTAYFLWMHLNKNGHVASESSPDAQTPSLDEWLSVVDEAASLGVKWLVFTLSTPLSDYPDIMELCHWAQDTYEMTVGLHPANPEYVLGHEELLKRADASKTQVMVKRDKMAACRHLERMGFTLVEADPQNYGETRPECQGPGKLIFVDPKGRLYTCGLVEGKTEYNLGNVREGSVGALIEDPELPHKLAPEIHHVSEGCDGCPSLLANFNDGYASGPDA